jgi:hypothetical protein
MALTKALQTAESCRCNTASIMPLGSGRCSLFLVAAQSNEFGDQSYYYVSLSERVLNLVQIQSPLMPLGFGDCVFKEAESALK